MKKTTFIIGAGASHAYEYPLGTHLISMITKKLQDRANSEGGYRHWTDMAARIHGCSVPSIDAYLALPDYGTDSQYIKPLIGEILFSKEQRPVELDARNTLYGWLINHLESENRWPHTR